jgi:hypothetical protein
MTNLIFWLPLALALVFAVVRVVLRLGTLGASFSKEAPSVQIDRKSLKKAQPSASAKTSVRSRARPSRRFGRS